MYTVYGIPNCNTVKKSLEWLKKHHIAYRFHDYKKQGITTDQLKKWTGQVNWEILLNKKGTTWRALDETVKSAVRTEKEAIRLMTEKTSLIKRPVITLGDKVMAVGFEEDGYAEAFCV